MLAAGTWAAGLGGSLGLAAAVGAYVWEALAVAAVAADAMLRAEEATYWAWSALALTLRIVAWISSSFLASANIEPGVGSRVS